MTYTTNRGRKTFELWGSPVCIEWDRKNFPESEPYYSVKQDMIIPDTEDPLDYIEWMQNQLGLMAVLYLLGFEVEVAMPQDGVIYWSVEELPW